MGDRPSPDLCDSVGGCYSWTPATYPVVVAVETRFGGVDSACGAREGVKRAVTQSILRPLAPRDERSRERRTLKRTFGRFRVEGTSWNTFMATPWVCVAVVPQRVEGLYLRLRRVSICSIRRRWEAMGDFYWGSALLLCRRSLILTQVAALAVWYQPVPGSLSRLPVTG